MATATSIVDFLTTRGFKTSPNDPLPLYNQRKSIYASSGLNLGDYRGTTDQNTALLNYLSQAERNSGVSINPDNLMSIINVAKGSSAPTTNTSYSSYAKTADNATVYGVDASGTYNPLSYDQYISSGGPKDFSTTKVVPSIPTNQSTPASSTTPDQSSGAVPADLQAAISKIQNPLAGRDLAQEAIKKFTGTPEFPIQQADVQAQKDAVTLGAQRDTESFIKNIASRGLIFSGAKNVGINNIEVDKMAKLLGIDRNYAMTVVQGLQSAAQDIAKQAQQGSADAVSALEKLGYVINPLTGNIEPTLAAKTSAASAARSDAAAAQPKEIDTFTDASGNRISVFMDPTTGELQQVNLGKAKDTSAPGPGIINLNKGVPTGSEVRDWIFKAKQDNPDIPYYDLWGQLTDKLKKQGLNPANYDQQFWEVLHPEGLAGYKKYVSGISSSAGINFDNLPSTP